MPRSTVCRTPLIFPVPIFTGFITIICDFYIISIGYAGWGRESEENVEKIDFLY